MDLPNVITLSRYVGALTFVAACWAEVGEPWSTLVLVLLLAVYLTDVVDGALARRQPHRPAAVGQVLDSATDSYTFVLVFLGLYVTGAAPLITLVAVVAGRALFDLIRFVSFALDHVYAAPITLSKAKGFIYSSLSCLLYAAHSVASFSWLHHRPVLLTVNLIIVTGTLVAAVAFVRRHRRYVRSIIESPTRALAKG